MAKYWWVLLSLAVLQQAVGTGINLAWEKLLETISPQLWDWFSGMNLPSVDPWALLFAILSLTMWISPFASRKFRERGKIWVSYTCDDAACFLEPASKGCSFNVFKQQYDESGCVGQTVGLYFTKGKAADWFKVEFEGGGHPTYDVPFVSDYGAMIHISGNIDGKRIVISEE